MRLKYKSTLDDLVDLELRLRFRSTVNRKREWRGFILNSFVLSVVVFVALQNTFTFKVKLSISILLTFFVAVTCHFLYGKRLRRYYRKFYFEQYGGEGPFPVEMELLPEGLQTKQMGVQIIFEWPDIQSITETTDSIEFDSKAGLAVVPERAFQSPEEMKRFIEEAQSYHSAARAFH